MCGHVAIQKFSQIAKPLLIFVNGISIILGIGQVAFGCLIGTRKISVVNSDDNRNETNTTNSRIGKSPEDVGMVETQYNLDMLSSPLIGVGVIIILLNMFGCIGSIKETKRFSN